VNRRVFALVGAILLALIGTFAIVTYVQGADDRALAGESVVKVLVVKEEIPAGTPATDLGDRVALEPVAEKVKADGAVTDTEQLGSQVASAMLVPGEQLVTARFIAPSAYRASGASVAVPEGLLQTTIALEPQRAVGGVLTPGSTVAVVASFTDPDESHVVLQKVLVTNVQLEDLGTSDSTDSDGTDDESDQAQAEPGAAPTGQLLVTLALDPAAVERVVFGAEHGTVWLALDPKSAREDGTRVVDRGNVYQ
jgi:pilus assembly protein CpaB